MKKVLVAVLVMLFWCNAAFAEKVLLTKCFSNAKSLLRGTWSDTDYWSTTHEDYQAIYNKNDNSIVLYSITKDSVIKKLSRIYEKNIEKLKKMKPSSIFEVDPNNSSMIISGDAKQIASWIDIQKNLLKLTKEKHGRVGYKIISKDQLAKTQNNGKNSNANIQITNRSQKFIFTWIIKSAVLSCISQNHHVEKHIIQWNKRDPKMNFSKEGIHFFVKHFWKPKINSC